MLIIQLKTWIKHVSVSIIDKILEKTLNQIKG